MANIVNCTQDHIRLLKGNRNRHLDVVRVYPAETATKQCLQPEGNERDLNGALVQPVRSVIMNCPDLTAFDTAYIVDMDVAVSLAERGGRACLLVPCDPFLVPELPHFTETYVGPYEALPGALMGGDDVQAYLDKGYEVYGYRRLLMVYAGDGARGGFTELASIPRANEGTDQDRLRKALQDYRGQNEKRINARLAGFRVLQSCVEVATIHDGVQTFSLSDAGVSQLLFYMDSVLNA